MLDVLIKNGRIIDGSGSPQYVGNIGIIGDSIAFVGSTETPCAQMVIDASEKIVCPGFIDIHSHADSVVLRSPERIPKVTQGVTTEVFSNCGSGLAPVTTTGRQLLKEYNRKLSNVSFDWLTVDEYLNRIPPTGVNVAYLIPHGALRVSAMGYAARHATVDEIAEMCDLAEQGMDEGAFGMSTGLAYVPMSSCDTTEVIALAKVVASHGGVLADHMRNYREKVKESVDETIRVVEESGVALQLSHYQAYGTVNWGRGRELVSWLEDARMKGFDITYDSYPYDFSAGSLKNTIPARYHDGGRQGLIGCLKDPAVRESLRREIGSVTTYDLSRLAVAGVTYESLEWLIGKRLPEAARIMGKDTLDFLCDILVEDPGILHVNFQGNADDVKTLAESSLQMVGSDSPDVVSGEARPHPRLWGAFPRFLRLFVRDVPILSWEKAVYKMTGFPAWRLGLRRRGLLRKDYAADVVVLDPATISDRATIENPEDPAVGIDWVIVNGSVEIKEGRPTQKLGGRVLRKGTD